MPVFGAERCLTVLQHVPHEPPGRIAGWALDNGLGIERVRLWAEDPLPDADALDALVVLGGPMSVHDTDAHPCLAPETELVRAATEAGTPVLGICLGAQLIAHALGGAVEPMDEREIGCFEVETTPDAGKHPLTKAWPRSFTPLHWHGERFTVPDEAVLLATSEACRTQAFALDEHVLGLQFHLEYAARDVGPLAEAGGDLEPGPWVQAPDEIEATLGEAPQLASMLEATLDAWVPDEVRPSAP